MGAAGWAFLPAIRGNPAFGLAAIAEPAAEMRETAARGNRRCGAMPTCRRCCGTPSSTPSTSRRRPNCIPSMSREACAARKHVLTEKPMAIRVEQAQAMVDAAERAGVVLQVGHSHCYDLPIARMREIVASGALGRVRMIHTWNFTDWMARPRRAGRIRRRAGRRRHLSPGRASDRHPAADRRRPGEERARHDVRLAREPPLDRRAHHLSEFCRRRGRDRGLQRLWTFFRRRVDRRRRRVGRSRAAARRGASPPPRSRPSRSWPPSASAPATRSRRARRTSRISA